MFKTIFRYEHQYGKTKANKFLKKVLDIYLKKRALDPDIEKPLMYNPGLSKSYIPYQKGSIVFNAMSEYLGEEKLNEALKKYLDKVKFQEAPYTTSNELVHFIRQVTPDSLLYLIKDMFETVTFYDNRILNVTTTQLADGKYKVDIKLDVIKYRINEDGNKIYEDLPGQTIKYPGSESGKELSSLPLKDYIEIGIFSKENISGKITEELIYNEKYKFEQIHNFISVITDKRPAGVRIDPFITLIDINISDNVKLIDD